MRLAICLSVLLAWTALAGAVEEPYGAAAAYTYGQSRKDQTTIEAEIRQSSVEQYPALEKKILEALSVQGATPDGKRFLLRMLCIVGGKACVPAVAPMLVDEKLAHEARMALERMDVPEAGAALRDAAGKATGKVQAGLVASLGIRRDGQAVSMLAGLLGAGGDVAENAVRALGQIGSAEASGALGKAPEALKRSATEAQIMCAHAMVKDGKKSEAAAIFKPLLADAQPDAVRVAAALGLTGALPSNEAAKMIGELLQGDDESLKQAMLTAVFNSTDPALQAAVTEQLTSYKPAAQQALLALLVDMPKANVRDGLLKLAREGTDEEVRVAALKCLVVHGAPGDCSMLLQLAIKGDGADSKAALATLERMSAVGVNEEIGKLLEGATGAARTRLMELVAKRRATGALPSLLKLAQSGEAALANEAVKAVEAIGTINELEAVAALLAKATDEALRGSLESAASAICSRTEDKSACEKAVLPALGQAQGAARLAVIRLLPRVRTPAALEALGKAISDTDKDAADAAFRALSDWPDMSAAPKLLELARSAQDLKQSVIATMGLIRLAGLRGEPEEKRLQVFKDVLAVAKRPDEKKKAFVGLADVLSFTSLELLQGQMGDAALASDAAQAAVRLCKSLAVLDAERVVKALESIKASNGLAESVKKDADSVLSYVKGMGNTEGFIASWMLSGPYEKEGKDAGGLFDTAFEPEQKEGKAAWKLYVSETKQGPRIIPLDKVFGGDNKVAYMKAVLKSEKAQEILFEAGSDDGIKVWLNGQVIHNNNAVRGTQPGQDKFKGKLNAGDNELLCKITQGGGEWSACVRLRSVDGGEVQGVSVRPK